MAKKHTLEALVQLKVEEVAELLLVLQEDNIAATEANKAAAKRIAILEKENAALQSTAASKEDTAQKKAILPTQSFTATPKGEEQPVEYVFSIAKFRHKGVDVTAEDALTDTALLQELVNMGSGVIREK